MYRVHKAAREPQDSVTMQEKNYIWEDFTDGLDIEEIAESYRISPYTVMCVVVKHFFKRKSASEKQSINYRMNLCPIKTP